MLTADEISGFADSLMGTYSQVEQDIMDDIARRIVKTGYLTDTAAWQLQKGLQIGMFRGDLERTLAEATGYSSREIRRIFKQAGISAVGEAALNSAAMTSIMLQGANATGSLLTNLTRTTAVASVRAFTNILDRAYLQIMTGAFSQDRAIKMAVTELARNGIMQMAYRTGNRPTSYANIESGVRRAVTTGVNQTCAKLSLARAEDLGTNLVQVSAHSGARPEHAVWQGQVYCFKGKENGYDDLQDITGYGTGPGLCGWNCYHTFWPFVEGKSGRPYDGDPDEGNHEAYELSQRQRLLERRIRESKREVATIRSAIESSDSPELRRELDTDLRTARGKLRDRQGRLRSFCDANGRRMDYSRTYSAGYNKPITISGTK